jgi:WhiB family transcriptional regulator, redox-sensing transcriptional regulator
VNEASANFLEAVRLLSWVEVAACRGEHQIFLAPAGERPETRLARESRARVICERCPVVQTCRQWARREREYGFWGAESEEERAAAGFPPVARTRRVGGRPKSDGQAAEPARLSQPLQLSRR